MSIYLFFSLAIILASILVPTLSGYVFNPDLLVIAKYLRGAEYSNDWLISFGNNTLLVHPIPLLFPGEDYLSIIGFVHISSVLFFSIVVLRYCDRRVALLFLLFAFYTVLLNQFRLAASLGFGIIAIHSPRLSFLGRVMLLALSVASHAFGGITCVFVLIIDITRSKAVPSGRRLLLSALSIILIGLVAVNASSVLSAARFGAYLEVLGRPSFAFIVPTVMYANFFPWISPSRRLSVFLILFAATITLPLSSISGRLSDLAFLFCVLSVDVHNSIISRFSPRAPRPLVGCSVRYGIVLALVIGFFMYRFYYWFIVRSFTLSPEFFS